MVATLTIPPASEPLTLVETKAFLKVDTAADDTLIERLIIASRQQIEKLLNSVLIEQTWSLFIDQWPHSATLELSVAPVSDVLAIQTYDSDNVASVVETSNYGVDLVSNPNKIILLGSINSINPTREYNGIEISVVAGFGPDGADVPEPIRQAMLLLIAHWFEIRQPDCSAAKGVDIQALLKSQLAPFRAIQL